MRKPNQLLENDRVAVIGGGLAGLACASYLDRLGIGYTIFEASDRLGGKLRTDHIDGMTLDRGFQVYLEGYPEGRKLLDYASLGLQKLYPGIYVTPGVGGTRLLSDPRRVPGSYRELIRHTSPTISDLLAILRVLLLSRGSNSPPRGDLGHFIARLFRESGVRREILEPLFAALTGSRELDCEVQFAYFLGQMLWREAASLPVGGMEAIPNQIASGLRGTIRLGSAVERVESGKLHLLEGEALAAEHIVVCTDARIAKELGANNIADVPYHSVSSLYFRCAESPLGHPSVVVPRKALGPILTVAVVNDIAPGYLAEEGALISISATPPRPGQGDSEHVSEIEEELRAIFGAQISTWEMVRHEVIHNAFPTIYQRRVLPYSDPRSAKGVYLAGDYLASPSINGALYSGRLAAMAVADSVLGNGGRFDPRLQERARS